MNYNYPRIEESEYRKAVWSFRKEVDDYLKRAYPMYGYQHDSFGHATAITELAEQFGMRVRGKDEEFIMPKHNLKYTEDEE